MYLNYKNSMNFDTTALALMQTLIITMECGNSHRRITWTISSLIPIRRIPSFDPFL